MEVNESKRIYISKNFNILIEDFIKKFKDINGINLSTVQATDLVYKKIKNAGGLTI